jgi:hypothetical protein
LRVDDQIRASNNRSRRPTIAGSISSASAARAP